MIPCLQPSRAQTCEQICITGTRTFSVFTFDLASAKAGLCWLFQGPRNRTSSFFSIIPADFVFPQIAEFVAIRVLAGGGRVGGGLGGKSSQAATFLLLMTQFENLRRRSWRKVLLATTEPIEQAAVLPQGKRAALRKLRINSRSKMRRAKALTLVLRGLLERFTVNRRGVG